MVEQELESYFFNLHEAVAVLNSHLEFTYINPAFELLFTLSQKYLLNKKIDQVFPGQILLLKQLEEGSQERVSFTLRDIEFSLREGKKVQLDISGASLRAQDGFLVFFRDRSSLKYSDEEKRAYDRLAMMGTLASGLAHEIKNPLTGIRASAEMIRREVCDEELIEFTDIIVSEVDRLNKLIVELLDFSQPRKQDLTAVNINKIVNEIYLLQKENLKEKSISCELVLDPSLPDVLANEDSLKQSILNFFNNAIEAIHCDGKIILRSRVNQSFYYKVAEAKSNSMLEFSIEDNGCGIKESEKKNLFTPFYTSKQGGNGLGLIISQRIISDLGGHLKIESEEGKGTKVSLLLRRYEEK